MKASDSAWLTKQMTHPAVPQCLLMTGRKTPRCVECYIGSDRSDQHTRLHVPR